MSPTNAEQGHRPVLIVGAGPVGLSAALAARSHGLPATVLEAEPAHRTRPGSRAIYLHGSTLQILDRLRPGLGWQVAASGLVWGTKRSAHRGRDVFTRTYPPPRGDVLPPFTSLPQVETERHLLDACEAAGAEIVWDTAIREVAAGPGGVSLSTASGEHWSADYVLGADGARSALRHGIGVAMEGDRSASSFVIVDVEEDPRDPLPIERVFHYEHPAVDRRNVLLVPFTGGWRADLQCREDDDPDAFNQGEGLRSWVAKVLGERYAHRIAWASTYQFLQVVAREFTDRHRRVLLIGEAAHLFAPFGARGLNSGVIDAVAAVGAVKSAIESGGGHGGVEAVDRFASERRDAAVHNRAAAGAALAHMQARSPLDRARRRAAAELAALGVRAGAWLDAAPYGPRAGRHGSATKY